MSYPRKRRRRWWHPLDVLDLVVDVIIDWVTGG